jgi:hypothetical protein
MEAVEREDMGGEDKPVKKPVKKAVKLKLVDNLSPKPATAPKPAKKAVAKKAVSAKKQISDLLKGNFADTSIGSGGLTKGEEAELRMAKALQNAPHLTKKEKDKIVERIKVLETKKIM